MRIFKAVHMRANKFRGMLKISSVVFASAVVLSFTVFYFCQPAKTAQADDPTYTIQTLDYIQFDGISYINVGVDQTGNTRVESTYQYQNQPTSITTGVYLFGSRGADATDRQAVAFGAINTVGGPTWLVQYGMTSANNGGNIGQFDDLQHTVAMENGTVYIDDMNNPVAIFAPITITDGYDFYLGSLNNGGGNTGVAGIIGKVYSFKISKDGVTVRDLVPAARYVCGPNAAVEYGFIDATNNDQWYGNVQQDTEGNPIGTLTGSSVVTNTACPVEPDAPPTEPTVPPAIMPPNTGFAR